MNIEKTISEHAVSDILTPMLESQDRIVTEDVAPLFDQATGLDTPRASGTVTTTIEESRNLITAIIRKAWTATLTMLGGASVIGYITAAYTYLRTRLQGNETYGIPDRRSEISASSPLAANLALLNDRKISGADVADGISLPNILCGAYADVLEITDDNAGWDASRYNWLGTLLGLFPNATKMTIGCGSMSAAMLSASYSNTCEIHIKSKTLYNQPNVACSIGGCEVWFDELETCNITDNGQPLCRAKKVYCPEFKKGSYRVAGHAGWSNGETVYMYVGCKGAKTDSIRFFGYYDTGYQVNTSPNLTDFEIRQGACQNLSVFGLVALTAENMYNHILCRLKQDEAGCGSGVTITLGTTNIEKLEAVEEYNTKLTELEDTYGYTFA